MKKFFIPLMCLSLPLLGNDQIPGPSSKAFVKQFLIDETGQTITLAPMPLAEREGSFTSLPLEGIAAVFELWVYPLIGPRGEELTVDDALLQDTEVVGVIPRANIEFSGLDPHPTPRTRADWKHDITVTITEPEGQNTGGTNANTIIQRPEWSRHFLVRKRFLPEELVGSASNPDNWIEVDSYSIYHEEPQQVETFDDEAFPPGTENTKKWSGIIEYQIVLGDHPESVLPLLVLDTVQVRVWPVWDATFANVPADEVPQLPGDIEAQINDIYPGTEKLTIDYLHKLADASTYLEDSKNNLYTEDWTAIEPQQRRQILAGLEGIKTPGKYRVRITMQYPWGTETDDGEIKAFNGGSITTSEGDPFTVPGGGGNGGSGGDITEVEVSAPVITIRGGINTLN